MTLLLQAQKVAAGYAGQPVIRDCSIDVAAGEVIALVGRNGAGKTTLVSAISGRLPLLGGDVLWQGRSIARLPAYRRSRLGIVHVPQGREVFARLTVFENLRIAAKGDVRSDEWDLVHDLFPVLAERRDQKAGTLSGGEQQMLAIGRAVLTRSQLMILDEPSLGLAPKIVDTVFQRIKRLRETLGIGLILVEQQTRWIWEAGIVDRVYVLGDGMIVTSGAPDELREEAVEASYLGTIAR
jgi:branched-chain amino acid transport system ATP-binding protein